MGSTFEGAISFNRDLSSWDVSNVIYMGSTFESAISFNRDLSSWDVSNVTSMQGTFLGATSFNRNLSTWNVSSVDNMSSTFWGATSFNRDLSSWNVSNVTSMWRTFEGATSFNGDVSRWNVSNVVAMHGAFKDATSFNGDLSSWNVSNVDNMLGTFWAATSFNGDLSSWEVSNVTSMFFMLTGATSFTPENYDALLTGWASLPNLQDGVRFGAPPTTYCAGKAGRKKLMKPVADGGYNWTIAGDRGEDCSAISIDEELLSNTKIYPNPTNSKINIESPFTIEKLELYNILGAKIFSVSKTNVLDLTSLSQGIYILKVFSEDRVISKKVVKD